MANLSRREFHGLSLGGLAAACMPAGDACAAARPSGPIDDFAFLHVSDTHLDPRPLGAQFNPDGRSVRALAWFAKQSRRAISPDGRFREQDADAAAPAFALHTGDVFEYSIVDACWEDWQRVAEALACPVYCIAGNHDNTWSSINGQLRRLHGGDSYSFDHAGCHFVCLNSAGSLDPLPCWDERTLRWLADDLAQVDAATPVLLAMHHPLSGNAGYASEYDKLRFWEVVRRHHVAYIMDGHWHQVRAGQWQNIPRVNGGETFRLNTGFAAVSVRGGVLTQRYHFHESAQGGARDAVVMRHRIDQLAPRYACEVSAAVDEQQNRLAITGGIATVSVDDNELPRATVWLDGMRERPSNATVAPSKAAENSAAHSFAVEADLDVTALVPGRHFATVRVESPTALVTLDSEVGESPTAVANEQAIAFDIADVSGHVVSTQYQNAAGIKTPLILLADSNGGDALAFGDTAGFVTVLDAATLQPHWRRQVGPELLQGLTRVGASLAAGDSDGTLTVLDAASGAIVRRLDGFGPIFGPGVVVDDHLYFGDANGVLHAVDSRDWSKGWSRDVGQYAIEAAPAHDLLNDRLIVGSWDGFYYAVDRGAGDVAWKAWNAFGQVETKSRYYGPGDCSPVVVGEEIWGTDRGYRLGRYQAADGKFLGPVRDKVAAIAAVAPVDPDAGVIARGLDDQLIRFNRDGSVRWEASLPLGRTPAPPTCVHAWAATSSPAGVTRPWIGAVSDTGLMTLVDAATGAPQLRWSTTPGLFVLAPLATTADGSAWYAAGMDGVVTRIALAGAASN